MSSFNIPPVSTLAGSSFSNYLDVLRHGKIHPRSYFKVGLTGLICLLSTPFHLYEKLIDKFKKSKPLVQPIFILGHWRSGTTHLHNILCQDANTGFVNTFNSLFPNNLHSQLIFRTFMKLNMPNRRPADNMRLDVDLPQEDEFAIGNLTDISYYNFFYFPEKFRSFYRQAVKFEQVSNAEIKAWERDYDQMLRKANGNTNGNHMLVKNPVNSARISRLLSMYPDARFIHIYRNPIIVYLSTLRFFKSVIPILNFQNFDESKISELVLETYVSLMTDLFDQQKLISPKNWLEIRFEDFQLNEIDIIRSVYQNFDVPEIDRAIVKMETYLDNLGDHPNHTYNMNQSELNYVLNKVGFAMNKLGYEIPDNLMVEFDQ